MKKQNSCDQLLEMWHYPPPMSFDGKTTWIRTAPAIERDLAAIIQQNKELLEQEKLLEKHCNILAVAIMIILVINLLVKK